MIWRPLGVWSRQARAREDAAAQEARSSRSSRYGDGGRRREARTAAARSPGARPRAASPLLLALLGLDRRKVIHR
jgi:hypothetical protein